VTRASLRRRAAARLGALGLGALGAAWPAATQARPWTLQTAAQARLEVNDNPNLATTPAAAVTTSTVTPSLIWMRDTESSELRAEAELGLTQRDRPGSQPVHGRLALRQALSAPRDEWVGDATLRRDDTRGSPVAAAELALGSASRTVLAAGLAWTHHMSERLEARWQGDLAATRYGSGAGAGSDYAQRSLGATLRWRASETQTLGLTLARGHYRQAEGAHRASTDRYEIGWSSAWSERDAASMTVGGSLTDRELTRSRRVCPLPASYCQAGLVPYVLAQTVEHERSRDLQYSAGLTHRWGEASALTAAASRALSPGALGMTREDALNLGASHAVSERLSAELSYQESRSRIAGTEGTAAARLRTLGLAGAWRLAENLSLAGQLQRRRYDGGDARAAATSNGVSVTLQFQGAAWKP
jgi:hypothetical protein